MIVGRKQSAFSISCLSWQRRKFENKEGTNSLCGSTTSWLAHFQSASHVVVSHLKFSSIPLSSVLRIFWVRENRLSDLGISSPSVVDLFRWSCKMKTSRMLWAIWLAAATCYAGPLRESLVGLEQQADSGIWLSKRQLFNEGQPIDGTGKGAVISSEPPSLHLRCYPNALQAEPTTRSIGPTRTTSAPNRLTMARYRT